MKTNGGKTKGNIKGPEVEQGTNDNKTPLEVPKKAEEKESRAAEGQAIEAEVPQALPMQEILDREPYLGADSTAVVEVTHIYVEEEKKDPRVEEAKAWFDILA